MPIDLEMFSIERVVIHEMPKRPTKARLKKEPELDVPPALSTAETQLDADQRAYLEERVKTSLSRGAYGARFIAAGEDEEEQAVPKHVRRLLTTEEPELVLASHDMAMALHEAEHGGTSEGLFVVALGRRGTDDMVAIIKLEKEEGVRLERRDVDGKVSIDLIIERELVLGENTKVFKTGVFFIDSAMPKRAADSKESNDEEPEIWVSDQQNPRHRAKVVADFYLRRFLRCEPLQSPEIQTAEWFEAVARWVNTEVEDPVRRTTYQRALFAELSSQKANIRPPEFLRDHIEQEDRASLRGSLREQDLYGSFQLDSKLIEPRIKQMSWSFESGVSVLAPQEHEGVVKVGKQGAKAKLTIVDKLKNVGAR